MQLAERRAAQLGSTSGPSDDASEANGIQSAVFGPPFWMILHMLSFNFPLQPTDEQIKWHKTLLLCLEKLLPCRYCRQNFAKNLADTGYGDHVFESRDSFSRFCYELHNTVNKMLGKECGLTYEDVKYMYGGMRAKCPSKEEEERMAKAAQAELRSKPGTRRELGCDEVEGRRAMAKVYVLPRKEEGDTILVDPKCCVR